MRERGDDRLPPVLSDAVDLLRHEEKMRPEWRAEVLRQVTSAPPRRVSLSVPLAIAAGLICMLAGGAVTMIAIHSRGETPRIAALASAEQVLPVKFSVVAPNAATVSIVGDFNEWNPATLPMKRSADGRMWEVEVRLPVGRYTYAFLIDGKLSTDPAAPRTTDDGFGTTNSVLMVKGS